MVGILLSEMPTSKSKLSEQFCFRRQARTQLMCQYKVINPNLVGKINEKNSFSAKLMQHIFLCKPFNIMWVHLYSNRVASGNN